MTKKNLKDILTVKEYEFLDDICPGLCLPEKADQEIIYKLEEVQKDCEIAIKNCKSILSKIREDKCHTAEAIK